MQPSSSTLSDQLAAAIRQRIVAGEFAPGGRLPTFQEIETTFSCSRSVAQLAIGRLKSDGFIHNATRQGLFVVQNPPHLRRYGIVFPVAPFNPAWSRFDEVFVSESRLFAQSRVDHDFEIFAGTDDYREGAKVIARLRRDLANDCLAGLILTPGCFELADQAPFNDPRLPKVFVFYHPGHGVGPIITGDGPSMLDRSLGYLAQQGCRRVAAIRVAGAYSSLGPAHFQKYGLEFRPEWLQVVGRGDTTVLDSLVPLLLKYPNDNPPDGLFILDDNLIEHVTAAIVSMGLRIGTDLKIVAHTNWPARTPNVLPLQRVGYPIGRMLARCIDAIDAQRRGDAPPDVQLIPALFESELDLD